MTFREAFARSTSRVWGDLRDGTRRLRDGGAVAVIACSTVLVCVAGCATPTDAETEGSVESDIELSGATAHETALYDAKQQPGRPVGPARLVRRSWGDDG